MPIPSWLAALSLILGLIACVLTVALGFGTILEDVFSMKWEKHFQEDLILAIVNSQPTWPQILQIAASRQVKNERVYWILQRLLRETLTGRNTDLAPHRALLETYIQNMKEAEPFEGMPKEIRVHLERLREQSSISPQSMEPLANQIRELLSVNQKEYKQQKYYTVGGFFVGILGFIFAAYAYFYPYQPAQPPVPSPNTSQGATK